MTPILGICQSGMACWAFTVSIFWEGCKLSFPKQGAGVVTCSPHSALCWSLTREEAYCYSTGLRRIIMPPSNYCLTCNTGMRHSSAWHHVPRPQIRWILWPVGWSELCQYTLCYTFGNLWWVYMYWHLIACLIINLDYSKSYCIPCRAKLRDMKLF